MKTINYNRNLAIKYARTWALSRNPLYYNFDPVGGDCTNFISQCLFAGSKKMNYSRKNGWYYNSGYDKSPSWTGVEFLYNFLTTNSGVGPRGKKVTQNKVEPGDIVQLSFDGKVFGHSLFVVSTQDTNDLSQIFIATHTYDVFGKSVGEYNFSKVRFIHIENVGV